jgi:hypothetical protein
MIRVLFAALMIVSFGLAMGGCKVEGEVGDTASSLSVPR